MPATDWNSAFCYHGNKMKHGMWVYIWQVGSVMEGRKCDGRQEV